MFRKLENGVQQQKESRRKYRLLDKVVLHMSDNPALLVLIARAIGERERAVHRGWDSIALRA